MDEPMPRPVSPGSITPTELPRGTRRAAGVDRTRTALRLAGLELFASDGFDSVTVDQIAERAGVSRRTFFRHFRNKDDVLFLYEQRYFANFSTIIRGLPPSVADIDAICVTFAALAPRTAHGREAQQLYREAVASSAVLRGREQGPISADQDIVAGAIADRHGLAEPDDRCHLLAMIGVGTYKMAFNKWLDGSPPGDLARRVVDEFGLLARVTQPAPEVSDQQDVGARRS